MFGKDFILMKSNFLSTAYKYQVSEELLLEKRAELLPKCLYSLLITRAELQTIGKDLRLEELLLKDLNPRLQEVE